MDIDFEIGDEVYLKTDVDQSKRIITGIALKQTGILYELCCGTSSSWHYSFEISVAVDVLMKTSDK